ncbi:hypothetical protein M9458_053851 [Cirrhinus mrigala]|uniref:DUF5641 domain-containing protein n=1 Tax=Cirrhinus mrigala TaxID=683832 RepID=A0ABD0MLH7_CIRMR
MAAQLERMKKKRKTIRSSATKLLTNLEEEIKNEEPDCDKLRELLSMLSVKEESLVDLDRGIENETSTDDLEGEIASALEYQDRIIMWKSRAKRLLERRLEQESERIKSPANHERLPEKRYVKLPKLVIDKFTGEISKWQEFWSQYEAAIHSNEMLSKKEKFAYLKTYLVDAAANAVSGLTLTDSNYDAAIELLQNRFGRKDIVISAHMSKLLNLAPVKRSSDIRALRSLYDECEIQIRSLESLGVPCDTYGSLLCPVLMQLMPEDVALAYTRQLDSDGEWKVPDLIQFLQREVQSRERALQLTRPESAKKDKQYNNRCFTKSEMTYETRPKKWTVSSAAALHTASHAPKACVYCENLNHKPENCSEYSVAARKERLKKLGRCFVCLGPKHIAKFCRIKGIFCSKCGRKHHQSICEENNKPLDVNKDSAEDNDASTEAVVSSVSSTVKPEAGGQMTVLLQTVKVWLEGPAGRKLVRCLLDGGSQRSFVQKSLVKTLELPVMKKETLNLHTFGAENPVITEFRNVKLELESVWNPNQRIEITALETPQVCSAVMKVPGEHVHQKLEAKGLQLADFVSEDTNDSELSVLIGADYYWQVVSGKVERLTESLVALESIFGWAVQGPIPMSSVTDTTCMQICLEEDMQISKQLRAFWEVESLGILNKTTESPEKSDAVQHFNQTVTFEKGRYQVELPWKPNKPELQNNFRVAKKRFEKLQKNLKADVTFYTKYRDVIEDYVQEGICEDVPKENSQPKKAEAVEYYLPHHAVIREDKTTTKLRVVFDASSHEEGCPSLNDCLLTGPNLNPNLLDVLIKFRLHKIAFTADITKAFLQIALAEKEKDAVRFLWLHGLPTDNKEVELRIMRMCRVVFGVSPSPFLLAATIKHHIQKKESEQPKAVKALSESLYVDDLIVSSPDVDEAYNISTAARDILLEAGMKLCKWVTNSAELKARWTENAMEQDLVPDSSRNVLRVLGLVWRPERDDFVFDSKQLLNIVEGKGNTKRNVLQTSSRIFDPIGFLTPFTVRVKCLLQEMWERGLGWDEQLPSDLSKLWVQWCCEVPQLRLMNIPRWYGIEVQPNVRVHKLHIFCDASEKVYGAVAYLQGENEGGETVTSFVASKTRVAPLKKLTLPRLELMGALIGARIGNNLLRPLNMEKTQICMWTDSLIALHWIKGSAQRWKPFVANRVAEIQNLTNPESWSHCDGKNNPADLATRGKSAADLAQNRLWWRGPESFTHAYSKEAEETCLAEVNTELRSKYQVTVQFGGVEPTEPLLDLAKYSKLKTVLRITAWIKRFITNTRSRCKIQGELSTNELITAEIYWVRITQEQSFSKEMHLLKSSQMVDKDSKIKDLNPFVDENGLICVGGRLQQSEFSFREQHPWVLPTKSRYSELLVQSYHERVMHSGVRDTLVQVFGRDLLGKASLNFEEMTTILTEVEAVLNSRPLSYLHSEADEPQPLTPSHFLIGKRLTSLPPKAVVSESSYSNLTKEHANRRWKYRQRLLTTIWNRWRKDYLMDLKSAHKSDSVKATVLKEGDVVLIGEDRVPRQTWKMGTIEKLHSGRDGLVRSCSVRTSSGNVLRRPVQLIYPLELV